MPRLQPICLPVHEGGRSRNGSHQAWWASGSIFVILAASDTPTQEQKQNIGDQATSGLWDWLTPRRSRSWLRQAGGPTASARNQIEDGASIAGRRAFDSDKPEPMRRPDEAEYDQMVQAFDGWRERAEVVFDRIASHLRGIADRDAPEFDPPPMTPRPPAPAPLFDASRNYLDQLAAYRFWQGKGEL